ncbi:conserved hypothetical protein [Uncinocarpus reesii 1704]|uniref:RING-type E3 ubiquitin transferase n=1 Tax=Uncinocarpus reesii (strain UAMH 1704) TaxID=336963 RepID=C4JEF2_UNCRE|nr:uncharacterized protein UREG_00791 [Uncinocarpus reesii 1704]EEP75944.1 conserved hypothetical protein [Uncinocarpus reesii 1704]
MESGASSSVNRLDRASKPKIMGDPAFASGFGKKGRGPDEPDTCRICRGEGSEEEELFYPCKCSGSIKFVHQSCLMEWLSHSQKKYCELCKTPFRFTKLYDPNMPESLPAPVFLKELMVHAGRSLLTWLRFLLVAFVWLGWLPWSMRAVWRGLFWLADGRWPASEEIQVTAAVAASESLSSLAAQGTSPVSHVFAPMSPTTAAIPPSLESAIPQFLFPVSSILNFTAGEPLIYSIAKRLLVNAVVLTTSTSSPMDAGNATALTTRRLRQPSWLSDVDFLNKLTPYPTINNILIDTLEGQLITLLVVILFIHVFLIREWVVQQQPAMNLAEGEREAVAQLLQENRINPIVEPEPAHGDAGDPPPAEEVPPIVAPVQSGNLDHGVHDRYPAADPPFEIREAPLAVENGVHDSLTSSADISPHVAVEDSPSQGTSPGSFAPSPPLNFNGHSQYPWGFGAEGSNDTPLSRRRSSSFPRYPDVKLNLDESSRRDQVENLYHFPDFEIMLPQADTTAKGLGDDSIPINQPTEPATDLGPNDDSDLQNRSPFSRHAPTYDSFEEPARLPSPIFGNNDNNLPVNGFDFRSNIELPELQTGVNENSRLFRARETNGAENEQPSAAHLIPPQVTGVRPARLAESLRREAPIPHVHPPKSLKDRAIEWFWGNIPQRDPEDERNDDERRVENPAQERPFVPFRHGQRIPDANEVGNNDHANRAAQPANEGGNDADAVDDADDLEGVLELIGMHGAIFGLLQNGVFSALLISFTVTVGIWLPYLWGKIALVLLTNPIRLFIGIPLALLSIIADVLVDTVIGSFAYLVYIGNVLIRVALAQLGKRIPALAKFSASNAITNASLSLIDGSGQRLKRIMTTFFTFRDSDVPMFSVLAHQALRLHQARITAIYQFLFKSIKMAVYDIPVHILAQDPNKPLLERLSIVDSTKLLPAIAAYWDTKDRVIAILVGYCFASLVGLTYLRLSTYFSGEPRGPRVNGAVAELLHQAGGVMKVILIIGIEMIVFPLYCGILLDIALMPLFENATFGTRFAFATGSPLTSLFVHWFIGTCYMFHFALFVSMCRKIMRNGVLCKYNPLSHASPSLLANRFLDFIRDPDDPTFHPVRDVLERNVSTQLRKIAFSALVYGALVVVCMGGVVWTLSLTLRGVLPLHWSSNEPVLEFPVDLLFYNIVMPLTIRSINPPDVLHNMYDWWFHKCARFLRLTDFLFGERKQDEEGYDANRTWWQPLSASSSKPTMEPQDSNKFVRDGRFVRTPASDQVRIPKGTNVFLEVNEENERLDGNPDSDEGLHGKANEMFTKVYVPPKFRTRIAAFLFLIWVFAATTGVGATILPLVIGRRIVSFLIPTDHRINDIYAFSAGIYSLGGIVYAIYHCHQGSSYLRHQMQLVSSPKRLFHRALKILTYVFNLAYTFGAFAIVIPSLFAIITELYFLVPIHTYLNSEDTHIIHFVQDWTLGVLYTRMMARLMLRNENSQPAAALKAIVRKGWFRPDVKFATRAFIIPAILATLVAVLTPLPIGLLVNATVFKGESAALHTQVYRYSYPGFLFLVLLGWGLHLLRRQITVWRMSIRDDVYLIGERLHNFGEKRARDVGAARRMINPA